MAEQALSMSKPKLEVTSAGSFRTKRIVMAYPCSIVLAYSLGLGDT